MCRRDAILRIPGDLFMKHNYTYASDGVDLSRLWHCFNVYYGLGVQGNSRRVTGRTLMK